MTLLWWAPYMLTLLMVLSAKDCWYYKPPLSMTWDELNVACDRAAAAIDAFSKAMRTAKEKPHEI